MRGTLSGVALAFLLAAGCQSAAPKNRGGFAYDPSKLSVEGGTVVSGPAEPSAAPAAAPAPAARRDYKTAPGALTSVRQTPTGTVTTTTIPIGWHCDVCGKTYNCEGWCHGQPLKEVKAR